MVVFPAWLAVKVPVPPKAPVPWTVKVPSPTSSVNAYLPSKSTVTLLWFWTVAVNTPSTVLKLSPVK